jgi:hypothetical protein
MRVFELAQSKSVNFADLSLPVSGLYLLAAPTTPEAARAEVIKRAKAGERLRHSDVTTIVDRTKGKKAHVDRTKGKQPASGTEPAPAVAVTTLNQTKTAPDSNKNKAEPTKAIPTSTNPNKSPPYAWMKALNPEVWMEALIVHAWNEAFPMDRSRALISIGLDALLAAIPEEWLPLIEEHAAERLLSIPPFLRRPMPKEPPA